MKTQRRKIFLTCGTRPNFIKILPLWREFLRHPKNFDAQIVHTGQHYDYKMSAVFFHQFELPEPHFYLNAGSGTHSEQTAKVMVEYEKLLGAHKPDMVIVVGDVNSTMAAAIVCAKEQIPVAHVEAGLRSFDMTMPEEINRIVTDRISDLLFASEPSGVKNLHSEGVSSGKIFLVGNVMIDTLLLYLDKIKSNKSSLNLKLKEGEFVVLTLHRPSNVDSKNALLKIFEILKLVSKNHKIIFPAHPRTIKNIAQFGLSKKFESLKNLSIVQPMGYVDFMNLIVNSAFVVTDSGGIQEETTWLGIPCITLRENTERPITCEKGTNKITGLDIGKINNALRYASNFDRRKYKPPKLWDGKASERIVAILNEKI